jgi:hypothetical protein
MNLPGRSAATLSALERVGPDCQVSLFPHRCLESVVQDDDLRQPRAVDWSGYPLGELAAKQTEGGMGAGNWKLQWKTDRNDRFFESILPSHRCRGVPEGEHLLMDYLILPRYLLAISLIGALYER